MPGEAMHQQGADGTRRAKLWLDATTRVLASWTNEDATHADRMEFPWPHGGRNFSFDIAGILHGEGYDGDCFLAECKKYNVIGGQAAQYEEYLAKCYVARRDYHRLSDQFMWITWHPFSITSWPKLCTTEWIERGLVSEVNRKRIFDSETADEAKAQIDRGLIDDVADRLWLIVLSDKQESLVITREDRKLVYANRY